MDIILRILFGISLSIYGFYYFNNEYKKGNFKIDTWVAGRGQSYFGVIALITIGVFLIFKQLFILLQF